MAATTFTYDREGELGLVSENQTDNGDHLPLPQDRSVVEITVTAVLLGLVILCAVLGNTSGIVVVRKNAALKQQVCNMFVVNLSIADLFTTTIVMCTAFVALTANIRYIHPVWCNLTCAANYCLIIVSMLTLSAISVERYIAVLHPLRYHSIMTRPRVAAVIVYTWVQGLAFGCTPVLLNWIHYDYWEVICAIGWQVEKEKAVYYVIVAFIANFAIPGFIMLFSYIYVIREAKQSEWPIRVQPSQENVEAHKAAEEAARLQRATDIKIITSLVVVVIAFFICMTPFCVTKLLKVVNEDPDFVPPYANLVASYFAYLSSMVNPLIYGILRKDFRMAYRNLCITHW